MLLRQSKTTGSSGEAVFLALCFPDLPSSLSQGSLSVSSHFHLTQWWANGSLWVTLSPPIPSFSLQINVLPLLFVQFMLLNQRFGDLSLKMWQGKEAHDTWYDTERRMIIGIYGFYTRRYTLLRKKAIVKLKTVEHWMISVSSCGDDALSLLAAVPGSSEKSVSSWHSFHGNLTKAEMQAAGRSYNTHRYTWLLFNNLMMFSIDLEDWISSM